MDNLFTNDQIQASRIIYTPSVFARANLLYLQETGSLRAIRPHISSRSNLASYLFFMVLSGSGSLIYNNQTYKLQAGDCVFLDCKKPYSQGSSEELWTLKWCHFYGSNLPGIYSEYIERGGYCVFHTDHFSAYAAILDEIYAVAGSGSHTRDMRIYDKLSALMTLIMEESRQPETGHTGGKQKRDVLEIKHYIDANYKEKLTLENLAERFYINKAYLTRLFKEQCGMTVTVYIHHVRITKAKELLRFTDVPMDAVAEECGIGDANYFARLFKKIEGITPGEYRRRWR